MNGESKVSKLLAKVLALIMGVERKEKKNPPIYSGINCRGGYIHTDIGEDGVQIYSPPPPHTHLPLIP